MATLSWIGKEKVINHHLDVPFRTLRHKYTYKDGETFVRTGLNPVPTSENKIIHGDNLEALKSLLPEYEGKIKCIYIDPPYNTGNEGWVYNDNVNHPKIKKWLGELVGKEGEDLSRHDKWLCMMYPRLKLLHKLLSEDGVIFVSINFQHEHHALRFVLDEIFGKLNYIGGLTWESITQPINSGSAKLGLQQKIEPILFYAKDKKRVSEFNLKLSDSQKLYPHKSIYGACRYEIIEKSDHGGYQRDTMKYEILGKLPRPGKRWQIGKETAEELIKNNRIEIVNGVVKKVVYPEDEAGKESVIPFWSHFPSSEFGTAQTGKDELNTVIGSPVGFDTVKPTNLVKELIRYVTNQNDIILDSFAGSGTTAHAVLNLNKQDGGNRKFILIELEDYADSITAERVKRVAKGYGEGKKMVEGTGGDFEFLELADPLFNEDGEIDENQSIEDIRKYVYYSETRTHSGFSANPRNEFYLGKKNSVAYYFYYQRESSTTLDRAFINSLEIKADHFVIYADRCVVDEEILNKLNITFKKIPRDIARI